MRERSSLVVLVAGALAATAITAIAWALRPAPEEPVPALEDVSDAEEADAVEAGDGPAAPFVAFARDFVDFREWSRVEVEGAMLPVGTAPGPTYVYLNRPAPEGARAWPVGTVLLKVVESGPTPPDWVVHGMVKRGVPYNRDGLAGWELFELRLDGDARPSVVWRGTGPPSGHGYAARGSDAGPSNIALVCVDCHSAAWQSDGVLTPAYALAN